MFHLVASVLILEVLDVAEGSVHLRIILLFRIQPHRCLDFQVVLLLLVGKRLLFLKDGTFVLQANLVHPEFKVRFLLGGTRLEFIHILIRQDLVDSVEVVDRVPL